MKRCWYCGVELRTKFTTKDHQQPQSRGGKSDAKNMVDCCKNCNHEKDNMDLEEYRVFVWLQKLGSPPFLFEQIKWLKKMDFTITVPKDFKPDWNGKFYGEKV